MKRVLKVLGLIVGVLAALVLILGVVVYVSTQRRINKTYAIDVPSLTIPTDAASIEEGHRLTVIRGCIDCHGEDYGGGMFLDAPMVATIYAANLTTGEGSATRDFTTEDWVRAIRHGVGANGKPLFVMPSNEYAGLSDADVARIIAYLRSAPPVDRTNPAPTVGLLGRALVATNQLPAFPAEVIDHTAAAPHDVAPEASAAYGAYLITSCTGCHGPGLAGQAIPGMPADYPHSANLTSSGELGQWTFADFATTLRTGRTPANKILDPDVMPWPIATRMTDVELEALWLYLQSLPPAAIAAQP